VNDSELKITYDTYAYGNIVPADWTLVRVYDYEVQQNENKRHIFLINRNYAVQLQRDLQKVINE
jgi:hypothetical protein